MACPAFTKFPLLPTEIRLKIWKFSIINPRRVFMRSASDRPKLDLVTGALLLVNFEAKQIFLENYTRCFYQKGQQAIYINFNIDTLNFISGLMSMQKMIRHYPTDMGKLQRIEISIHSRMRYDDYKFVTITSMVKLTALKQITVTAPDMGNHSYAYDPWYEYQLTDAAECIRRSILHGTNHKQPYVGPQLAIIFPCTEDWVEDMYFVTGKSLCHARYGCLTWEDDVYARTTKHLHSPHRGLCDGPKWLPVNNFDVCYLGKELPWPLSSPDDIFEMVKRRRNPPYKTEHQGFLA
ncbi:hypothetical protein DL95DRAFT_404543 [Leptodontidium sp. 2 PMI_412]|nr:hypothetical protein DL95DRAFT_404543 [Leptodontidium sp. 2 PMI_412]